MALKIVPTKLPLLAAASALLLLAACSEGRGPFVFAADDGESGAPGPEDGPEEGGECSQDSDCPSGYACYYGYCDPQCGAPAPSALGEVSRGVPVNPACSEDDSEWDGEGEWDGGDPPLWCNSSADCDEDQACMFGECITPSLTPTCAGPSLTPIELPLGPEGAPVLDLRFVDFDGDGRDELVLLRDGALLIVEDGFASETTVPAGLDLLVPAQLDDDGVPDLLLASRDVSSAAVVRGSTDNFPLSVEELSLPALHDAVGLDWIAGGSDELALVTAEPDDGGALLLEAVASAMPSVTPLADVSGDRLATLELDGGGAPELLSWSAFSCRADVLGAGGLIHGANFGSSGCAFAPARLNAGLDEGAVVVGLLPGNGVDVVGVLTGAGSAQQWGAAAGQHGRVFGVRVGASTREAVLLADPDATLLWTDSDGTLECSASLPELTGTINVVSGDVDADGNADLAALDVLGELRLWATMN